MDKCSYSGERTVVTAAKKRKSQKKEDQGARKGRKVAKQSSLKRRVRRHLARWEIKKCTPLWREARFETKSSKTPWSRITFGRWDLERAHAIVVQSTFGRQNEQNTWVSEHSWKLRCSESACRRQKHFRFRPLLGSKKLKKRTPALARSTFQS